MTRTDQQRRHTLRHGLAKGLGIVVAWMLAATACTSGQSVPATAPAQDETSSTTTVTTTPVTTTTRAYRPVEVAVADSPEAAELLSSLYTWLSDRDAPQPALPAGLAEHLNDRISGETGPLTAQLHTEGVIYMGIAGVAVVDDKDIILLVDDGDGWRVVGAWFARYGLEPWFGEPIRHVLVIGTDAREWQDPVRFRGDSLHILSSNVAERGGGILGFPRDSWIEAPYGMDKFTHVNATIWTRSDAALDAALDVARQDPYFGYSARARGPAIAEELRDGPPGQEVVVDVAAEVSGLPLEGYISTGFRGFQLLLNDYGGVEVDIPFAMADISSGAFFKAGVQFIWGKDALAFSRNRHLTGGDFTRSFHQGLVILARLEGITETEFSMLPRLISGLASLTSTDLSLEDLMTLGAGAFLLDPSNVGNEVAPGRVATRGGASVVLIDDSAEELYRDLDDGVLGVHLGAAPPLR